MKEQIKVMIIDDSALARQVLSEILITDPGITIIGAAADPIFAERYMQKEWPDVILLDLEMPRMDGMTFLRNLMQTRPTPVVICSGLAGRSATVAMAALSQGAVEVISKPEIGVKNFFHENAQQLIQTVRAAALAKMKPGPKVSAPPLQVQPKLSADVILPAANPNRTTTKRNGSAIVAIGASTGGTTALEYILLQLKPPVQPILIVQHMPEKFTLAFAQRLDQICGIAVKEAEDGDAVSPNRALIAPGGRHMMLKRGATGFQVHVSDGPLVNRHRPSVDVLFRSVARETGGAALGILLTGMGDDGAAGLLEMKQVGCRCVAQDEKTSVVFGMPKEAKKRGAADKVLPLENMPDEIIRFSGETNG